MQENFESQLNDARKNYQSDLDKDLLETLNQPRYQSFQSMKTILIKACVQENFESQLNNACKNYQSDLDKDLLQTQLLTLGVSYSQAEQEEPKNRMSVFNIREYLLRVLSVH